MSFAVIGTLFAIFVFLTLDKDYYCLKGMMYPLCLLMVTTITHRMYLLDFILGPELYLFIDHRCFSFLTAIKSQIFRLQSLRFPPFPTIFIRLS